MFNYLNGIENLDQVFNDEKELSWPQSVGELPPPYMYGFDMAGPLYFIDKIFQENKIRNFCELGSYLGASAHYVAGKEEAKDTNIYAIDIWDSGALADWEEDIHGEYIADQYDDNAKGFFKTNCMYKTFLSNLQEYKEKVIPLKTSTQYGVRFLHDQNIEIDVFYIDANHTYDSVKADILIIKELFPNSIIFGDDLPFDGVKDAVKECARLHSLEILTHGNAYMYVGEGEGNPLTPPDGNW